ncbi:MAG TPA: anthranilate phosphoribosyltransferase [Patescibacteria group bacterium]|nr:anthranilate phosphoribosyltransferase [Patescibacteria group bacterium]
MINLRQAFEAVIKGRSLNAAEAESVMGEILDDVAPDALVAGFLVALKMKGESAAELSGGVRAMRRRARPVSLNRGNVLDTAGTGGDGAGTFNISTGAALIAATAGVPVAKHGNRAVSSRVGAADVLEHLGVRIELDPAGLERCLKQANICFVFAPAYHPVLARLAVLRRTLGIRTVFNLTAPMANPARPRRQLLGVAEPRMLRPVADALAALDVEHAMVVHGNDGLDEISLATSTSVAEIREGKLKEFEIAPETYGLKQASAAEFLTADLKEATELLRRVLGGDPGPAHDVLALNGGAAIYVGGGAKSLAEGVELAHHILDSGRALETIEKMRLASLEGVPA